MWIPAIDLVKGQSVRLYQGDFEQKSVINSDPLAQAQAIEASGLNRLHLVDLDGAKVGKPQNIAVIRQIVTQTKLKVEVGGGIRTFRQVVEYLSLGVDRVIIGSAALSNPDVVRRAIAKYGSVRILVGVDGRDEMVAVKGWQEDAKVSMEQLIAQMAELGVQTFIVTDIGRDGTMLGPNIDLLVKLKQRFPKLELIASGGIRDSADLQHLKEENIDGAIIGKALANGSLTLAQLEAVKTC